MEKKILENRFHWIPLDERTDRLGLPVPPRKPETRRPLLWLTREGEELYFVNSSGETLDWVGTRSGGGASEDDDIVMSDNSSTFVYKDVGHDVAVKVAEFDDFYDLDFIYQASFLVRSNNLGRIRILAPPKRGGIGETVLLWDTMEPGKYVNIFEDSSE